MLIAMPDRRRFRLEYGPQRTCRLWQVGAGGPTMVVPPPAIASDAAAGWWPIPDAIDYLCLMCGEWGLADERCDQLLACTACGEARMDALLLDDMTERCTCTTCGHRYVPGVTAPARTV